MRKKEDSETSRFSSEARNGKGPKPLTKTRLRRGEIRREKTEPARTAQIIDFLPAVHSDIENLLCDLSGDNPDDLNPPGPSTDSL